MRSRFGIMMALSVLMFTTGCNTYLDELWRKNVELEKGIADNASKIAELEKICEELNVNIKSLSDLVDVVAGRDHITSIVPLVEDGREKGYIISFAKSPQVTIFHGKDGLEAVIPTIGIRQDESDGFYYWTLNGEWIVTDNGRLRSDGTDKEIPRFELEDGMWKISYDEGKTWTVLGNADGKDAESMFSSIVIKDGAVVFTFSDGSSFSVPRSPQISITFDIEGDEMGVEARQEITVRYRLENATEKTVVTAMSDGNYKVSVHQEGTSGGYLKISSPKVYRDGHVTVLVYDGEGFSFSKLIRFYKREISFPSGMEYRISPKGGIVSVGMSLNFEYEVKLEDGTWVSILPETKADARDEVITCQVAPNYEYSERRTRILFFAKGDAGLPVSEVALIQDPAYFNLDRNRFVVKNEASSFETVIRSSMDISAESAAGWLKVSVSKQEDDTYILSCSADLNPGAERYSDISIRSMADSRELGIVQVLQLTEGGENPDDMILKVRAVYSNSFRAFLPLDGEIDCTVDWGDGSEPEHWTQRPVSHTYTDKSPADYTVRISGRVTALNSSYLPSSCVKEVIQWGKTGLTSMAGAFANSEILERLPEDNNNAFVDVTGFESAFENCFSLNKLPESLFTKCDKVRSFSRAFSNCTSIEALPDDLFRYCESAESFDYTFAGCRSLTELPEDLFRHNRNVTSLSATFKDCNLTEIPERLLADCRNLRIVNDIFYACPLSFIPQDLFRELSEIKDFTSSFSHTEIVDIPEDLFSDCVKARSFSHTFSDCDMLVHVPASLLDHNRQVLDFTNMFAGDENLSGESPFSEIGGMKVHLYERGSYPDYFSAVRDHGGCFINCPQVEDYEEIPEDWK